jgi:hypothetical protein
VDAEKLVDLESGLKVTADDRAALRRLREQSPSWLDWDWRELLKLVPPDAVVKRPTATDAWQPFRLG